MSVDTTTVMAISRKGLVAVDRDLCGDGSSPSVVAAIFLFLAAPSSDLN